MPWTVFFKRTPFVRLLLFIIIGVLLEYYLQIQKEILLTTFGISCFLIIAFSFLHLKEKYRFRSIEGALLLIAVACLGSWLLYRKDVRNNEVWFARNSYNSFVAEISEPLTEKTNSFKTEANILFSKSKNWERTTGKIIIYFAKDSVTRSVKAGNRIVFKKQPQIIQNSGNPGAFDYVTYCRRKNIYHQIFLRANEYRITESVSGLGFDYFIENIRTYIVTAIQKYVPDKNAASVASALLIGYKTDLDKDLIQAYSNTGVVHIIAISGMHLALIYAVLLKIVSLVPWLKKRKLRFIFLIVALWLFSVLTGSSPSILRAAVMFSFIIGGELLDKKHNQLNNLAASAFCLLLYDPNLLWDAGFQLSYTAVAGIMLLYRSVYNWFYVKNKLLDAFWKLNAVTLSAQVFTIPLVLYHFHQFPNLFLFTNMVAVPLSGLILYAELFFILFIPIPLIAAFIGKAISFSIVLLNGFIQYMNEFALATTENISAPLLFVICLTLFIALFCSYFFTNNKKLLIASFCFLLFTVTINLYDWNISRNKQRLIVYNISKKQATALTGSDRNYFLGNKEVLSDPAVFNFHIKPTQSVFRTSKHYLVTKRSYWKVGNTYIETGTQVSHHKTDVFIISGNPPVNQIVLKKTIQTVVADNTNSKWKINQWKKQAEKLHLRFHSVPDDGAFIMEIPN